MYFTLMTHLNLDTEFSPEILDLYLDLIQFSIAKVNLHAQIVASMT